MFDISNGIEKLKRSDKLAVLDREFPGESCGNAECENLCAEALHIAMAMRLDPKTMIEDSIRQGIAPKTHCVPASAELTLPFFTAPCRFGFVRPDLTCIKNSTCMPLSSVADEEYKVIAKKYIADSDASKEGACKECLKNANHIFKWPEEAHLMPKLPIHPNCKCHYENVYEKKDLLQKQLFELEQDYLKSLESSKLRVKDKAEKTISELQQLQNNQSNDCVDSWTLFKVITLMVVMHQYANSESFYLLKKLHKMKKWIEEHIEYRDWVKSSFDWLATQEQEIMKIESVSKEEHYKRLKMKIQRLKYLPKSPKEALEKGFIKAKPSENRYHGLHLGNEKYYHPISGQEVVFEKNGNIVLDERFLGTYNKGPIPRSWNHVFNDVLPYWKWGNSPNDTNSLLFRIMGKGANKTDE